MEQITTLDMYFYIHIRKICTCILGPYSKRSFQLNFCVQDSNDSAKLQSAHGNYCMYDIGKGCANGKIVCMISEKDLAIKW